MEPKVLLAILAHPDDASALAGRLEALGMPEGTVTVLADDSIGRGSLAVQTELGASKFVLKIASAEIDFSKKEGAAPTQPCAPVSTRF